MNTGSKKQEPGCSCDPGKCTCSPDQQSTCLCPVYGIIDIVSKKWTICIVSYLSTDKTNRFSDIKKKLGKISPRSLTSRLKELEKFALIKRKVFPEVPPRVEYSLTKKGKTLREAMMPLVYWVRKYEGKG